MTSAGAARRRSVSAAWAGSVLVLLPLAFLAVAGAAASFDPDSDSGPLLSGGMAAVELLVVAAWVAWVVALRRATGHGGAASPALGRLAVVVGACATATPLVQAATGRDFQWGLTIIGAAGVLVLLLGVAAYRPRAAVHVAVVLSVVLVGTGWFRERPQGDPAGSPPASSPGQVPAPTHTARLPPPR